MNLNLFRALFGRTDSSIGAAASPPVSAPIDTDDGSGGIGELPDVTGDIIVEPAAPSRIGIARSKKQLGELASETSPTPSTAGRRPQLVDPQTHARQLLSALIEWNLGGRSIPYAYMIEYHRELCRRLACQPGPWNPIASEFRRLTGGKKTYRWFKLENGQPHRLRVYVIPHRLRTERFAEGRADIAAEARSAA